MRRLALWLLAVTLLALFAPLLVRDRVVFPHDNTVEAGLFPPAPLGPPSNRRLSDASHYYLPALAQHLNGDSAGWISTWDPHVELGRPTVQLYGLGKAFLPTRVLAWFSHDALRVYTWSAALAVALACLFGFLLLEALALHPLACLTGALGIGIGSLTMYSLAFTLFLWGVCWTTALFWCLTLHLRRPTLWSGCGLALFTHALLLSGYPQFIVWQAYALAGYALLGLVRHGGGARTALARGARLAAWVALGALSVAPVYWELYRDAQRSTRLAFDPEFFAHVLPSLDTWAQRGAFTASLLDACGFGSPAAPEFPYQEVEPLLLPLWACLAAAGLALCERRRLWPIALCVAVTLTMTVWPAAYVGAVHTFGFGLSRSVPIRLAHLPLVVLAALAADRILRAQAPGRGRGIALIALAAATAGLGLALAKPAVERADLAFASVVVAGTLAFVLTRKAWLLAGLALASALVAGAQMVVTRARDEVCLASPLVERLAAETAGGARFAWAGANPGDSLAPNQEALFGLCSIHSYDPLFASRYQDWAARYRQTQVRGTHDRRFLSVIRVPEFLRESAALAATTVLVSGFEQKAEGLTPLASFGPLRVLRVDARPILQYQTERFERTPDGAKIEVPRAPEDLPERIVSQDEHLVFRLAPSQRESLLFVSQQFHPDWRARAEGRELETLPVNGIFQGVLVPPGVSSVELSFESAARWSWVPQVVFALAGLGLGARRFLRRA